MKEIHHVLELHTIPPVAKRGRHALILVVDDQGYFYLSTKKHYPAGISRLLGGGLEGNEDAHVGAARELNEETGMTVDLQKLKPLAQVELELLAPHQTHYLFITYLYLYHLGQQTVVASDDVDEIVKLSKEQYLKLLEKFTQLSPTVEPNQDFAWADYGKIYGLVHQIALDEAKRVE